MEPAPHPEGVTELLEAMREHHPYTAAHGMRVAAYARRLAAACGYSGGGEEEVYSIALLHDIGKLHVPAPILSKAEPLSPWEMTLLRRHPEEGSRMLRALGLPRLGALVGAHHERVDGQGYPKGIRGRAIPEAVRIVTVADVYDAITSERCYQHAAGWRAAEAEILRVAGTQLDAAIVSVFLALLARERAKKHRAPMAVPARR